MEQKKKKIIDYRDVEFECGEQFTDEQKSKLESLGVVKVRSTLASEDPNRLFQRVKEFAEDLISKK